MRETPVRACLVRREKRRLPGSERSLYFSFLSLFLFTSAEIGPVPPYDCREGLKLEMTAKVLKSRFRSMCKARWFVDVYRLNFNRDFIKKPLTEGGITQYAFFLMMTSTIAIPQRLCYCSQCSIERRKNKFAAIPWSGFAHIL
jgi:hypothetical protein